MDISLRFLVMVLYTPAACGIALVKPYYGLLALVAMYYFRPDIWNAPDWFRPILWITLCVGAGWIVNERKFRFSGLLALAVASLLMMLVSAVNAARDTEIAIAAVWTMAKVITVGFLTLQLVDTPKKINLFLWTNVFGMFWNIKTILILGLLKGGVQEDVRVDVGVGQGGGSNYLAMILVMTVPFFFVKLLHGSRRERLFSRFMAPVYVLCVVLTGSRGGFLALFVTALYVILRSRKKAVGIAGLVVVGVIFLAFLPQKQWERFERGFKGEEQRDFSATSRLKLWGAAWTMFQESPVLGKGPDNYQLLSPEYAGFYAGDTITEYQQGVRGRGFVTHSTWFQTLAEGGLGVSLPFFGMFALAFVNLFQVRQVRCRDPALAERLRDLSIAMEGLWVAFITASSFGSHIKIDFLWWYMGLTSALAIAAQQLAVAPPVLRARTLAGAESAETPVTLGGQS